MMKRLFPILTLLFLTFSSCSVDDGTQKERFELAPITEIALPTRFKVNEQALIEVNFIRKTDCHAFNGFYRKKDGLIHTFAVEAIVFESNLCAPLTENNIAKQIMPFTPFEEGIHTLKFWGGKDDSNNDIYLTYEIIVEP